MTERLFRVERNGILMFETNLNPGDGVFLSNSVDLYIASLGAEAPADVEEVQGEMTVESEDSEVPVAQAEGGEIPEPETVTEKELQADDEAASIDEMTVNELKDELRAEGLPVSGTKAELVERLEKADYHEWTVDELKDALRSRGLMVGGTKDELIERLEGNDELEEDEDA